MFKYCQYLLMCGWGRCTIYFNWQHDLHITWLPKVVYKLHNGHSHIWSRVFVQYILIGNMIHILPGIYLRYELLHLTWTHTHTHTHIFVLNVQKCFVPLRILY